MGMCKSAITKDVKMKSRTVSLLQCHIIVHTPEKKTYLQINRIEKSVSQISVHNLQF